MGLREPSTCVLPPKQHLQQVATAVASREDEVEAADEEEAAVVAAVAVEVKVPVALEGAGRGLKLV